MKDTLYIRLAQREVRDYIRKASKKGLVLNPMENTICATALFSAGIEVASERKANYVTIKDIEKGWRQKLMACPGNTPPHRCLSRTVLSRIDELRGERPLLDEMLRELIK